MGARRRAGSTTDHRDRPQRPVPLLVGGLLVALALGAMLGRATAPTPPDDPDGGPDQPAETDSPGPARVEDGVPVGYARSEQGAVAAAAQYTALLDGKRALVAEDLDAAFDQIAAAAARDQLARSVGQGAELMIEGLGLTGEDVARDDVVIRPIPAGYRVTAYSDDEATVEVWGTAVVFAEGRQALSDVWSTVTLLLRWERGDWRLVSTQSQEGPTPPSTPTPADPTIGERINAFDPFVTVPTPQ